jgi:hypothetical protein
MIKTHWSQSDPRLNILEYEKCSKKIAPSGGRRENCWGFSCEKSRFYAKNHIFPILGGGGVPGALPWIRPCWWWVESIGTLLAVVYRWWFLITPGASKLTGLSRIAIDEMLKIRCLLDLFVLHILILCTNIQQHHIPGHVQKSYLWTGCRMRAEMRRKYMYYTFTIIYYLVIRG